jgi:hypothetical protein
MTARLNMNEIRYFSWKGRTFNKITSIIKKNIGSNNTAKHSFFMPQPLKIYRREIGSTTTTSTSTNPYTCNGRISTSIDLINMPGGSIIVNSDSGKTKGLVNTLDINLTSNKYEIPRSCQNDITNCMSQVTNARRRVRSSGIIKKQFDLTKNNDRTYHTSTNQYLVSRNRTFQQNQYYYIRQGDSNVKPGDSLSVQNVYSSNGINHCKKYFISADTSFQYQWVDSNYYTVNIPSGNYNTEELNNIFKTTMTSNKHYFIKNLNNSYVYLLNISYNDYTNKIELQSLKTTYDIFNSTEYSLPLGNNWWNQLYLYPDSAGDAASRTNITLWPGFKILDNIFKDAIGFSNGNYPSNIIPNESDENNFDPSNLIVQGYTDDLLFTSSFLPGLQRPYVTIYYKPNNPQFAQQGAVTASSHTVREKYNAITNNSDKYRKAYGLSVANALAYGVPENGYTWKDKIGYPNKKTPVISKYTGEMKKCEYR